MSEEIRDKLARDLAEVTWREIRPHVEIDSVIVVGGDLELLEVAVAVAEDDTGQVGEWIASGQLTKPGAEQVEEWEGDPERIFRLLIARPFLLVQEVEG